MTGTTPFRHHSIRHMVLAPTIWALHFVSVYAITAIDCAKTGTPGIARAGTAGLTLLALIAIGIIGWQAWVQWNYAANRDAVHNQPTARDRRTFLGHGGFLLSLVSLIGVVFVALPALFIRSCL